MNQIAISPTRSPSVHRANWPVLVLFDFLYRKLMILETWRRRHQARMQFAQVEAHTLQDIGISESQRFIEVNKLSCEN